MIERQTSSTLSIVTVCRLVDFTIWPFVFNNCLILSHAQHRDGIHDIKNKKEKALVPGRRPANAGCKGHPLYRPWTGKEKMNLAHTRVE